MADQFQQQLRQLLGLSKAAKYDRIALAGRMRSGKDSVGDYLVKRYGFKRFAFGDGVKAVSHAAFGKQEGGKNRALYQQTGQKMREVNPTVWIDYLGRELAAHKGRAVITDLRQPNEIVWLRNAGFVIVRVWAPEELRIARMVAAGDSFKPEDLNHETEQHVDGFLVDYVIRNDGTLEELRTKTDRIVAK